VVALAAFSRCGCSGFARIDFFLERASGRVFLNELNTLPGFTSISMFPKLWQEAGLTLPALLARIMELAFERFEARGAAAARRRAPPGLR